MAKRKTEPKAKVEEVVEEKKEVKEVKKPRAVTNERVSAVQASERTLEDIKGKFVEVIALKGAKHMVEGEKYTIGKDLAKTLLDLKRVELA